MVVKTGRLIAFGLICCLLALAGLAGAEGMHTKVENPALETSVQLGYDGWITYGKPVPVRVTIRNNGGDLEGIVAVNAYASSLKYDRFEAEISIPAGGERTVVLPMNVGYRQDLFTVEVLQNGEKIQTVNVEPEGIINPSAMLIGVLSSRPRNLANLDINVENDTLLRYEYWQTVALAPETLPDDPELLDSFGMIVLDDIDPAQLTEKQQKALKDWIREGHVLLCGGGSTAPRNLAFLSDLTDLKAEEFTVSDGVHTALENYAERKATNRSPEVVLARVTGGDPLVSDDRGNGLIWRETAGSGCVYVLAWEAGDALLNAESLMHVFYQQMLIKEDPTLYNTAMYSRSSDYAYYSAGSSSPVPVRHNSLPLAAILLGVVMLAGGALWIVLQRRGAAKWMWLIIPVLALAAAAVILLLAGGSSLNQPVAAAAVNLVQDADGNMARYTAVTVAAPSIGIHRWSLAGENTEIMLYDDYYYYDDDEDEEASVPAALRVVRTSGGEREVAVNAGSPWEESELRALRAEEDAGRVEAEIWMEEDGLHGTVTNRTVYSLKEGAVLCVYGFVRVPALKPGESADFVLLTDEQKDPSNPVYENGKMYLNTSSGLYSVVYALWSDGKEEYSYDSREGMLGGMLDGAADQLSQNGSSRNGANTAFFYCAEPEDVAVSDVYAGGKPVENTAVLPLLTAGVKYLTVGRTGVVFHTPGTDQAVRCQLDGEGLPAGDMPEAGGGKNYYYNYFTLSEKPTFRFALQDLENVEITKLVICMESWYVNELKCYVLNVQQRKWVEIDPNTAVRYPSNYIDADGNLYCQFRPNTGDSYMDIPAPTLMLEGRVINAEP